MLIYIFLLIVVSLLLLPMILISFVRSILSVFGFNFKRKSTHNKDAKKADTRYAGFDSAASGIKRGKRKKIFDKDDGEYVDFEEIK